MSVNPSKITHIRPLPRAVVVPGGERVDRVRCVLSDGQRFLLVQHKSRRAENYGKWTLPGGRLKPDEREKAGLRRELAEELAFRVPYLVELGAWAHGHEYHRIFGCEIDRRTPKLQSEELLASAWLEYSDVKGLAAARQLRWGFELAAIATYRRLPRDARSATTA